MSVSPTASQDAVQDAYSAITAWIPRRKATIAKMEKIADEIKWTGAGLNGVKLASSCIGVLSSTTFHKKLLGASGAFVSCSVDIIKADMLSRLLVEELQEEDIEMDEYKSVINALAKLHKTITAKSKLCHYRPASLAISVGKAIFKVVLHRLYHLTS